MTLRTKVKCPKCGHENNFVTDKNYGNEVVYCNCEDGGCDNWFVVKYRAVLDTSIYLIADEKYTETQNG